MQKKIDPIMGDKSGSPVQDGTSKIKSIDKLINTHHKVCPRYLILNNSITLSLVNNFCSKILDDNKLIGLINLKMINKSIVAAAKLLSIPIFSRNPKYSINTHLFNILLY
ncbi:hypothetical protein BSA171_10905 [Bacillus safensis]|nr:hypothetical protein BSA41_06810 [Bacillus safensis]APT54057.1 hypothetical protein BSA171_10905 [Bacillus safensis]